MSVSIKQPRGVRPSGRERLFGDDEIIVSKTDCKGVITYANHVFLQVSGYAEHEVLGQPHNMIRHPEMPRCVFKLLWDTIKSGKEIFAYVINLAKNGDHYWVLAHVTPTFDNAHTIIGYHSSRRSPKREAVEKAEGLYAALLAEELKHETVGASITAGTGLLLETLSSLEVEYDEFAFSL